MEAMVIRQIHGLSLRAERLGIEAMAVRLTYRGNKEKTKRSNESKRVEMFMEEGSGFVEVWGRVPKI